jgi:hypothetical protein
MGIGIEDKEQTCLECDRICKSRSSLGNHVTRAHVELGGLIGYTVKYFTNNSIPLCKCGCKKQVNWHKVHYRFNDYISGHNATGFRVKKHVFTEEQLKKRNDAIRRAYSERKEEISKKISIAVTKGMANSEFDFKEHHKSLWANEEYKTLQHESRVKSWSGEAGDDRKARVFTEEFGRKIGLANMRRENIKQSKIEIEFVKHVATFESNVEASKWFNFTSKTWCCDAWIPEIKLMIELDGSYWHGLDRNSNWGVSQIKSLANDLKKCKIAIDKGLNLIKIDEKSAWRETKSIDELKACAYHVVENGVVVKDGALRLDDKIAIVNRDALIKKHFNVVTGKPIEGSKDDTEKVLLPALIDLLRAYVDLRGWIYAPLDGTLGEALTDIRKHLGPGKLPTDNVFDGSKAPGSAWLKSKMRSFWSAGKGPVVAFQDDKVLERVLRYRLGLNVSKDYEYNVSDESWEGTKHISCNEHFDISLFQTRRGFVVQRQAVSWFKPVIAAQVWKSLIGDNIKDPVVWDPSAGFGARLLGFAAAYPEGCYMACEPASSVHTDLWNLIDSIQEEHRNLAMNVEKLGSEGDLAAWIPEAYCDAVFTSPPYFDLERYWDEPGQCWRDYPSETQWYEHYLVPTMKNVARVLKPGAKAAFNVDKRHSESVLNAAKEAGLLRVDTWKLTLQTDHFSRKRGISVERSEPIFVFEKYT